MNKHDIDNFMQRWDRFCTMSRYGQYDLGWGIAVSSIVSSALFYIWS